MRRSKLELYEDVIFALSKEALTLDDIAFECDTSCVLLQDQLQFLVDNDIVSIEVSRDNRAFYVLTRRGAAISKTFAIARRLEKLQTSHQTSAKALQAVPAFPETKEEKTRPHSKTKLPN
jgi:predicted transcriptional regulator